MSTAETNLNDSKLPLPPSPNTGDYYLLSIQHTQAPTGSVGNDWHVYRIAQGTNVITGYRRGTAARVTAEVEQIIDGLNERRMINRGRVNLTPPRSMAERAAPVEKQGS